MAFGDDFTPEQYQDIYSAANTASWRAGVAGQDAARVADPYGYQRRNAAADSFDRLLKNPGQINSSPVYKYLMSQQMNAVKAKNAAMGLNNSGRGMLALQKSARDASSEAFFPLLSAYGKASGAFNPLSAPAAALAIRGSERSQDYDMMAAAARAAGKTPPPAPTTPWWAQPQSGSGGALPSGGSGTGTYSAGGGWAPSYIPSTGAGTGYVSSDYGTTTFGGGAPAYAAGTPDYAGVDSYDPYTYSDYGDGGYSDFGYGDYGGDY